MTMMLNEPLSSGSHWRIPTPTRAETPRIAQPQALSPRARAIATAQRAAGWTGDTARSAFEALITVTFVGSVVVAPLLALAGLVGLFAPLPVGLRAAAPAAIFAALLWVALALLCAHLQACLAPDASATSTQTAEVKREAERAVVESSRMR